MKARFVKADPCGNTTVFVLDYVEPDRKAAVAQSIMSMSSVGAEQVGFLYPGTLAGYSVRMDMMGGEFCGNASRSFAAWMAFVSADGLSFRSEEGKERSLSVQVSGSEEPLACTVISRKRPNCFYSEIEMPLPESPRVFENTPFGRVTVIPFGGISHIILADREPEEKDPDTACSFLDRMGIDSSAYGLMYYNVRESFMRPRVIVRSAGTDVWESSCGSGSCALATALSFAQEETDRTFEIRQPGGELAVRVIRSEMDVQSIRLGGELSFSAAGWLYLDD